MGRRRDANLGSADLLASSEQRALHRTDHRLLATKMQSRSRTRTANTSALHMFPATNAFVHGTITTWPMCAATRSVDGITGSRSYCYRTCACFNGKMISTCICFPSRWRLRQKMLSGYGCRSSVRLKNSRHDARKFVDTRRRPAYNLFIFFNIRNTGLRSTKTSSFTRGTKKRSGLTWGAQYLLIYAPRDGF